MTKAKYEVLHNLKSIYSCITTTRNTEDMINILMGRYEHKGFPMRIRKTCEGVSEIIYTANFHPRPLPKPKENKLWKTKPKPVIDSETGQVFSSISQCANHLNVFRSELERLLKKNNYRYKLLKPIYV